MNKPQVMSMDEFLGEIPEIETTKETTQTEAPKVETIVNEEEEKIEPKVAELPQTFETTTHDAVIEDFLADGEWDDISLEIGEEGETVKLSELKGIDRAKFKEIKAIQDQLKKEKFSEKYIDVEGLDETTKNLVKIKKEKGDISQLIKYEVEHVHPLENFDLEDEDNQANLAYRKYRSQGLDHEASVVQVEHLKKSFKLDVVAKQIASDIDASYKNEVAKRLEDTKAQRLAEVEAEKEYKKSLLSYYKEIDVKDSVAKALAEASTTKDGLSEADKLFFEAKNDPKLFAEVIYLLKDKKGYEEQKGVKVKNETVLKTFKLASASSAQKTTSTNSPTLKEENKWDDLEYKPLT